MSSEALAWAFKVNVRPSAVKFTLIALCECANYKTGKIFPSIEHLSEITGQDRKTIIANVAKLEAMGLIRDTGERGGRTKQIKVYEAALGTVPKTEQLQKRNSSVSPPKQSQKRDTEPSREPSPLVSPNGDTPPAANDDVLKPEHVVEAWNDTAARVGLSKVVRLTDARRKRLRTMIAQHPPDDFAAALDALERSPFCRGERSDWKADFDFFLQTKSFTKLLEGAYG